MACNGIAILTRFLHQVDVMTLSATTIANVDAHVQAHTVSVGVTPMHVSGMQRASAITFPYNVSRIEEVETA